MRLLSHCLFALLFLISSSTFAADKYVFPGAGATSCGSWLKLRAEGDEMLGFIVTSWVQGFLSGMNVQRYRLAKKDMVLIPDSPSIQAYVDKYCRDNPLKTPFEASISMYREISEK